MSGLAGSFFTREAGRAALGNSGRATVPGNPWCDHQWYVDADVALFVAGRFPRAGLSASFGEITETDRYVVALEGYVVNLADLAGAEALDGRPPRAEVLLTLLARHGPAILAKLNGGYNLIVWNKSEKTAIVNNCKFGQRNLYTVSTGPGITIASDLQTLKHLSGASFELNHDTIGLIFLDGGVPGRATPLKHVAKVLPGSILLLKAGSMSERPARDIAQAPDGNVRRETAFYAAQLDGLMRQAVSRLRTAAETHAVMVGSGVDSSLVAAYAKAEISNLAAVTQRMPPELDESIEAVRIVKALGIAHTVVPYEPRTGDLLGEVAAFVRIAEEPAYWNQLGPPLLRLLTLLPERPQAFLTGAEGDLLFNFRSGAGVSVSQVIKDGLLWPVARYTARRLVNRVTRHTYIVGTDFDLLDRSFLRQHIVEDCLALGARSGGSDRSYPHLTPGPNAQRHFLDNGWQNVRIISQLAREVGSEALFPYLDDDVLSCVLSLPNELKINKSLLRILLSRFLSRHIVPTTKKGYWAHTIKWHYEIGALQDVLDLMSQRRTLERGIYNPPAVLALIDAYAAKAASPRCHPVLWQLLVFEMFCREFVDRR